jgi:hypothetical protein
MGEHVRRVVPYMGRDTREDSTVWAMLITTRVFPLL